MPYSSKFLRLILTGHLYVTDETFSFGLNFHPSSNLAPPDDVPAGVVTACTKFWQTSSLISQGASLELIKLNEIGTDGRYTQDASVEHEMAPKLLGTGTSWSPPSQVAMVVSTRTAANRGRAHAGRFYLPIPGRPPVLDGMWAQGEQSELAKAAWTWITELNTALPGYQASVLSNLGIGAARPITHVRVGKVFDTMRSRRSSLDENYYQWPVI
jgi:hypothetical protein